MNSLTRHIENELIRHGADIVGVGDLTGLPDDVRNSLPIGISVAVKYPKEVIRGITELPTQEYHSWYNRLNERLDSLVAFGAETLQGLGYKAVAKTRAQVGDGEAECKTVLPHKTVATRAGIGWIGKCALLVAENYGSMIRLSSILTDAPLTAAAPIDQSKCEGCMICAEACPAKAVSGKLWEVGLYRDEFFDPIKCRETAKKRSKLGFGTAITLCGKCIEVCPYTQRYIASQ